MGNLTTLFNLLAPLIGLFAGVYLTYLYNIRHKRFETKLEYHRKVRVAVTNLMLIWKELARIQKFLKDPDPTNEIVYKVPAIAKKYLCVDSKKIDAIKVGYAESLKNLQDTDTKLYFKLVDLLAPFENTIEYLLTPLLKDKQISKGERDDILVPLVDDLVHDLQLEIIEISIHLPKKERKDVKNIIDQHVQNLSINKLTSVPDFIIQILNKVLPLKEPITSDEIIIMSNNNTFIWLMNKFFKQGDLLQVFKKLSVTDYFKLLVSLNKDKNKLLKNLSEKFDEDSFIRKLEISEEEEKLHLIDNQTFYKIVYGLSKKFSSDNSWTLRRNLVLLNNGKISVRDELEMYKENLAAQKYVESVFSQT